MIVREQDNEFIMIEQDNHARLSGELAAAWKESLFNGAELRGSVEYAISRHDLGWKPFDTQPFWNDAKSRPYTFTAFPVPAKAVLYKHGIEEVAAEDSYAALLCSRHYTNFLQHQQLPEAKKFVQEENKRRERIMTSMEDFKQANYDYHYAMLQVCDNISLFVCLNNPGVSKQEEHPFFQNGLPSPNALFDNQEPENTSIQWLDEQTVELEMFPFENPFEIALPYKMVTKSAISNDGIAQSYQTALWEEQKIRFVPKE